MAKGLRVKERGGEVGGGAGGAEEVTGNEIENRGGVMNSKILEGVKVKSSAELAFVNRKKVSGGELSAWVKKGKRGIRG